MLDERIERCYNTAIMKVKFPKKLSGWQILCLSYLAVILVGALLLCLPIATRRGEEETSFIKALFMTTSATCVTGNIAYDTNTHWTIFGQTVIICLIQLGGLGVMTFVSILFKIMGKKISLSDSKLRMIDSGENKHSELRRLFRRILLGTLLFEGIGAVLLSVRFVQDFGWGKGIYYGVWHSISAFCNAGFDLLGGLFTDGNLIENSSSFNCALTGDKFVSLTPYATDPLVSLTVCGLIILGGLGFCVWGDVVDKRCNLKKFTLHTKVVLSMTGILLVGGTLLFLLFERNNPAYAAENYTFGERLLVCFFSSVTPRTAGFNTSDMTLFSNSSILLTLIFMFIGGAPASTAGGIKVTTTFVIIMGIISVFRGNKDIEVGKRRVHHSLLRQALAVFVSCLAIVTAANLAICAIEEPYLGVTHLPVNGEPFPLLKAALVDTFSAMGTVGLSLNFSPNLQPASMLIMCVLMYTGRVGIVTLGLAFAEKKTTTAIRKPSGDILIG